MAFIHFFPLNFYKYRKILMFYIIWVFHNWSQKLYSIRITTCSTYLYEDRTISMWLFNFLPFNLKSNTAPVNIYPSIDNCQYLSKLRRLFVFDRQPREFLWKSKILISCAHQVLIFAGKTSIKPRIRLLRLWGPCTIRFNAKRVIYFILLWSHKQKWRSGRPTEVDTTETIGKIYDMMLADWRYKVHEIVEVIFMSYG